MNKINKFKIALCQIKQGWTKQECLEYTKQALCDAKDKGANFCVLGEAFNCVNNRKEHAEELNDSSKTLNFLKEITKELKILVIGSIPEKSSDGKIFNTALVLNRGELIAKYRKIHLFDIDIPGKMTYKESSTFSHGDKFCLVDTEYGKIGVGICFDLRFSEMSAIMAKEGAKLLVYPGNFTLTTGPLHWELLIRSRAVDNQVYVAACSLSKFPDPSVIQAYGHSMLVDPKGKVLCEAGEDPQVIVSEVDYGLVDEFRQQMPYLNMKRQDLYTLKYRL